VKCCVRGVWAGGVLVLQLECSVQVAALSGSLECHFYRRSIDIICPQSWRDVTNVVTLYFLFILFVKGFSFAKLVWSRTVGTLKGRCLFCVFCACSNIHQIFTTPSDHITVFGSVHSITGSVFVSHNANIFFVTYDFHF